MAWIRPTDDAAAPRADGPRLSGPEFGNPLAHWEFWCPDLEDVVDGMMIGRCAKRRAQIASELQHLIPEGEPTGADLDALLFAPASRYVKTIRGNTFAGETDKVGRATMRIIVGCVQQLRARQEGARER